MKNVNIRRREMKDIKRYKRKFKDERYIFEMKKD